MEEPHIIVRSKAKSPLGAENMELDSEITKSVRLPMPAWIQKRAERNEDDDEPGLRRGEKTRGSPVVKRCNCRPKRLSSC